MLPWSVSAMAGMSNSAARLAMALAFMAPSSSEKSEWLCRWTKVSGNTVLMYAIRWLKALVQVSRARSVQTRGGLRLE